MTRIKYVPLFIPALLFCALVAYSTRWGPGVGYDSMFYLDGAVNLARGNGVYWIGSGGDLKPLTHYPPVYSIVMAAPIALGINRLISARLVGLLISILNPLLLGIILYRLTSKVWFTVVATVLIFFMPVTYGLHVLVMSEPLFFFWLLLGFYLLTEYLTQEKPIYLYTSALTLALAGLTRYAGMSALITGVLGILLLKQGTFRDRISPAIQLATLGLLPIGLWMGRNWLLTGTATNRTFQVHLIDVDDIRQLLDVIVDWFTRVYLSHWIEGAVLLVFFTGVIVYLLWRIWFGNGQNRRSLIFTAMVTLFPLIYIFQVLVSLSFFDASTRLGDRILSPVLLSMLLICILLPASIQKKNFKRALMIATLLIALIVIGPRIAVETMEVARSMYADGSGFSSREWQESDLIRWVQDRTTAATIITNQAMPVRFLTGVAAIQVPEMWDPVKDQERSDYQVEMQSILDTAAGENTYVLMFESRDIAIPQNRSWLEEFQVVYQTDKGKIFVHSR